MKFQPNRDYKSSDIFMTPPALCERIIKHFKPRKYILEPCCGTGNFCNEIFKQVKSAYVTFGDISGHNDFLGKWGNSFENEQFDYVVSNFPWSKFRPFLKQSMRVSDNVISLCTVNHFMTKARIRDIREANFGFKEILMLDMPKEFPQSGFQLGAVHLKRGYKGSCKFSY